MEEAVAQKMDNNREKGIYGIINLHIICPFALALFLLCLVPCRGRGRFPCLGLQYNQL